MTFVAFFGIIGKVDLIGVIFQILFFRETLGRKLQ